MTEPNAAAPLSDVDYLNGLADNELDAAETAYWTKRIEDDPLLKQEFENILAVKSKLSTMMTGYDDHYDGFETTTPVESKSSGSFKWAKAASVAALLLVGAVGYAISFYTVSHPEGMLEWHQHLSQREYVVEKHTGPLFVSLGQDDDVPVPDLRASKLYLVDTMLIDQTGKTKRAVMHYRGLSGCRLTLWSGPAVKGIALQSSKDIHHWNVGDRLFGLIATGMDPGRFASIAKHVETITKQSYHGSDSTRIAMNKAYRTARSCV